ncbi:hypothetical protein [Aeromicrobium sp. Root472D3]|uniref:hypothetical protein n=1 Tax=Aeromicrobium sp. Root472D3 TaxID=1736540 RepID=UPI00138F07C1|nr:hypothetical protein [Aeromicrobium sp. Root472D3]
MMTRRVLIGTGVAVVGAGGLLVAAEATGRLDDVADAVGLDPRPEPDPGDTRILRRAATATAALLAGVESTAAAHPELALDPVAAIVREQLAALGGATPPASPAPPADVAAAVDALATALDAARTDRRRDALAAGSPALVRVLASMSAGHAQGVRAVRGLR